MTKKFMYVKVDHDECECFHIPVGFFSRCLWCELKRFCKDDNGELADRDSDHCRHLHYHIRRVRK